MKDFFNWVITSPTGKFGIGLLIIFAIIWVVWTIKENS